jgi:predicted ATPase
MMAGTCPPTARRLFVGRDAKLAELRAAFDAAPQGHGSLIVIHGPPGIGKTALCEQLAHYVEEGAGRPA